MNDKYIGKLLDNRYEILQVIGTGGMAVVYKALCHRLNRYVAVKILKDEFAKDEEFRSRFRAESHAVAMLSHPNIVAVYDVSRSNSIEYIVMELIDGMTLKQYIERRGVLSQKEAIHFTTQILKALSHAHSKGIIHRDIKPHNIMLLRDSTVKVADFGIARLESSQRTITREAFGSVHYIAPEQARGSNIDCRADIYSTGVVLYEMLTGRLPYEGDTPVSVAIQHINSLPLSPREINPEIPEALEKITMKAMSSNLSKRYASTDEMLADLEAYRKNPNVNISYVPPVKDAAVSTDETKKIPIAPEIEKEPQKETEKENPLIAKIPLIAAVVAVIVFIAGIFALIGVFSGDEEGALLVPDIVGMTIQEAQIKYSDFEIEERDANASKFSDIYDEGEIIEQSPKKNETVSRNKIYVVLSKGAKNNEIQLTNLVGRSKEQAEILLQREDLTYEFIEEASNEIEPGYVTKTIPESGETVSSNTKIIVFISTSDKTKMPNLSEKSKEQAKTILEHYGLKYEFVDKNSDETEIGYVIETSPEVNEEILDGTTVMVYISSGKASAKVSVPKLTGVTEKAAGQALEAANLKIGKITREYNDTVKAGYVIRQELSANTSCEEGTSVGFTVSLGPKQETGDTTTSKNEDSKAKDSDVEIVRTFRLPQDRENFEVKITVGEEVQYQKNHTSADSSVEVTLKGSGVSTVRVYVDNELQQEIPVEFK